MARVRIERRANYTTVLNTFVREKKLSLKAKGLMLVMLSLPDDWDYSIAGLVAICKESEKAVTSALHELKEFGYVRIDKLMPDATESGRIEYEYVVSEQPFYFEKQAPQKQGLQNGGLVSHSPHTPLINNKLNINNTSPLYTPPANDEKTDNQIASNDATPVSPKGGVISSINTKREESFADERREIIDYLNAATGKHFSPKSSAVMRHLVARLREGYSVADCKRVIDVKTSEWKNREMEVYLRPETLFGSKFDGYLNQRTKKEIYNESIKQFNARRLREYSYDDI